MDIKSIIKEKGYTIEQVAKKMGVTRVTLTQSLSRNPTLYTLQRVADAIGCKVGEFFLDEIQVEPNNTIHCPHCGNPIDVTLLKPESAH